MKYNRKLIVKHPLGIMVFITVLIISPHNLHAENIYELRKLTEDDWLKMSTEERMRALSTAVRHVPDQAFLGDFGRNRDLYKKWGYEYYEMEDEYETYAHRNIINYDLLENRRRKWSYNEFGDRVTLMRGTSVIWKERYFKNDTFEYAEPSGYIKQYNPNFPGFLSLWVLKESTDDWAYSIIGSPGIRTGFTPLTLSTPNLRGVSFDFQTKNTSLKIVTSGVMGASDYGHYLNPEGVAEGGVLLRGGHLRRKFGVLTLGATYVTTYGYQRNRQNGYKWRGTLNDITPTPIMVAVRFMDDSPEDREGGPVVYDIRLKINGRFRPDIQPQIIIDDISRDRLSALTYKGTREYLEPPGIATPYYIYHKFYNSFTIGETPLPKYADYFYLNDLIKGTNIDKSVNSYRKTLSDRYYSLTEFSGKPIRADGTETIVCLFDLVSCTEKIYSIEAVTTVANDYHIQTGIIYKKSPYGSHDTDGKNAGFYDATYWQTAAQSEGNIKDSSNIRTVTINFGFEVANIIYGFDADFNYWGFKIKGEYVTNIHNYMFPEGLAGTGMPMKTIHDLPPRKGQRFSKADNAYYVTTSKDWKQFGFAGEIFKMGKFYRPYMDYYYTNNRSMRQYNITNNIARIPLVVDNDDDDIYPDTMLERQAVSAGFLSTFEDPDGVFPGNDKDHDGIPDTNKNLNGVPDSDEPFLMFDSDPYEFDFGNDYNNNTIPDFREDDMKLDTPYDLDRRGHHFFLRYTPKQNVNFYIGSLRTRGVGISNRTNDDYLKFLINYDLFRFGKLFAEYRCERIQDNISDKYIDIKRQVRAHEKALYLSDTWFERELCYDELEYRNSKVHRLWIDSAIRAMPSITLENYMKFERNEQVGGIMYDRTFQPHDMLSTLAMSNKIVYTRQWGNWIFSPGIKLRLYKKARSESLQPRDHYSERIPLVMLKYVISPRTDIAFGMQGIPGCEYYYKDHIVNRNSYKRHIYLLQLQNRSIYFGYNIWVSVGATLDTIDFEKPYRKVENEKISGTFVKIYCGWE